MEKDGLDLIHTFCCLDCSGTQVGHPPAMLTFDPQPLHFTDTASDEEWYRPVTLAQFSEVAVTAAAAGKTLRPVCANTGDGVVKYYAPAAHTYQGTVYLKFLHNAPFFSKWHKIWI